MSSSGPEHPADAELAPGQVVAGRYRLDRRIGEGGMGVVWGAENTVTGRRVALKMLRANRDDERVRRRFMREGRAASSVVHPNVIQILDVVEIDRDRTPAIVMELLEGESLGRRIRRERVLSSKAAAEVMIPAIAGVGAAHAQGVVHRDLKPDNIFLATQADGSIIVKVVDFGIAKMTAFDGEALSAETLTNTGAMLGTPYYMSPEQLFANGTIDYRSDIWSLGIILYELLSGLRPTRGDNFAQIVKVIATGSITPLQTAAPSVPIELAQLVTRMLALDPEQRPQSLREVLDELRHFSDVHAVSFGEPVLAPIGATRDAVGNAAASTKARGSELIPTAADTPRARKELTPSTLGEGAGNTGTHDGLGITLSTPRRRFARGVALGGASVVAVAAAFAVSTRSQRAQDVVSSPNAGSAANVETAATSSAPAATERTEPVVPTAVADPSSTASGASSAAGLPAATRIAGSTTKPSKGAALAGSTGDASVKNVPSSSTAAPAPGGLVEKPPF